MIMKYENGLTDIATSGMIKEPKFRESQKTSQKTARGTCLTKILRGLIMEN